MGIYTDKARITGLSGIDTESMVQQLMKAESAKLYRYQRSTQTIKWKRDALRDVASTMQTFQKDFLSFSSQKLNFLSKSTFSNSKTTIKDSSGNISNAINIISSSKTSDSTASIVVDSLAASDVYESSSVGGSYTGTGPADLSDLKTTDTFKFTLDGVTKEVSLAGMTDPTNQAEFESYINTELTKAFGTTSGGAPKASISFSGNVLSFSTIDGSSLSMQEVPRTTTISPPADGFDSTTARDVVFTITDDNGGPVDVNVSITEGMTQAQFVAKFNEDSKAKGTNVSASIKDGKISFSNPNSVGNASISGTGMSAVGFADDSAQTIGNTNFIQDLNVKNGASTDLTGDSSIASFLTFTNGDKLNINGREIELNDTMTVNDFMAEVNKVDASGKDAGVKISFDKVKRSFKLESKETGAINAINITDTTGSNSVAGFFTTTKPSTAQDAKIIYNGVEVTRTSNKISIDDMTIELKAITNGDTLTLSSSNDIEKSVSNIKSFVEEYNKLIDSLNTSYTSPKSKTNGRPYQPLTDDEKKAMSEKEITDWEKLAKEGLLQRDSILGETLSELRTMLYEPVELPDGTKISLADIGITTTSSYNDGGKIEIDEAKLTKALSERGDDIAELFTRGSSKSFTDDYSGRIKDEGISERLNDIIRNVAGATGKIAKKAGLKNSMIENQSTMFKELKDQEDRMTSLIKNLARKETQYYTMFSKLEAAINQANSQGDALASFTM